LPQGACRKELLAGFLPHSPLTFPPFLRPLVMPQAEMAAFQASITVSQQTESGCLPSTNGSAVVLQRGTAQDACLVATQVSEHGLVLGNGDCSASNAAKNQWTVGSNGSLSLASAPSYCFHANDAATRPCAAGNTVWLGEHCSTAVVFNPGTGTLVQPGCPGMCAGVAPNGDLALTSCSDASATGWVARNATLVTGRSGAGLRYDATRWVGEYLRPLE
jgi:hypothetical protein